MADFVKKDWKCGDTITADELNRLEGGVEEALDKGYECKEGYTLLTDESVTTAQDEFGSVSGTLAYSTLIDADTIKVTFNGAEYICENRNRGPLNINVYGAPHNDNTESNDWSEYPFVLICVKSDGTNRLITETAGTYQVKIEALEETIETSECFKKAVESARTGAFQVRAVSKDAETGVVTYNCSSSQLQNAFARGDYITLYDELSGLMPLMLRDCVVGWDTDHPTLVGMVNYVTRQAVASNSQVTSLRFDFNPTSSEDEMLTSGGGK